MNEKQSEIPSGIKADRTARVLTIAWADGHSSKYPFWLIRAACPCATCRGGHENMRSEPDPDVYSMVIADSPRTQLKKIEPVGSYALTIEWEDGHHFGIFNWHYLRALCPCEFCKPES